MAVLESTIQAQQAQIDERKRKQHRICHDIIGYLEGCGISAERRSIYRDIEDINRIMLMLQEDIDLDEVDMMFEELISLTALGIEKLPDRSTSV